MKTFDKQQRDKHYHEACIEFIPKHSHGKERLCHGKPRSLPQMGLLNCSQMAKEDFLDGKAEKDG
jgi:hypothetical protein